MSNANDDSAGSQEPERSDLEQALLAARFTACKLMDEHPIRPPVVLRFETENRWRNAPLVEAWVTDYHVCASVAVFPSDVAWAFFMWETRRPEARERWGSAADALQLLHDHLESWIRSGVVPAFKLHRIRKSPWASIDLPDSILMVPLRDEDDVPNEEPDEREAPRLVHDSVLDGPLPSFRPFRKPDPRRKKARPPFYSIRKHLERAAYAAGFSPEDFKAPFPRGHLSAAEARRRDELAIAVHELRAKGSQEKQVAKELSLDRKAIQRLNRRGAELAPAPQTMSRPGETPRFTGKKVRIGAD